MQAFIQKGKLTAHKTWGCGVRKVIYYMESYFSRPSRRSELYVHFLHEQVIAVTISIAKEYRLTCVAAKNDVINSAR